MFDRSSESRTFTPGSGTEETGNMRGRNRARRPVVLSGLFGALLAVALVGFVSLGTGLAQPGEREPGVEGSPEGRPGGGKAKNVILLIGDGMGESEITIARNYEKGAAGRLALDALPLTGDYTTYAVQEDDPSKPDYVPDSAATGTAWATGEKTSNGRISTTPGTDRDLKTILELAQEAGYKTGDVSTAELTDATPAVLAAQVRDRSCQGPQNMAECPQDRKSNGGPGSIAEQEVDEGVDVLLGAGRLRFEQVIDGGPDSGKTVIQSAERQGYRVIGTAQELEMARSGQKLLGLFNAGNMSLEWTGQPAAPEPGTGPQRCQEGRRPDNEPSLAQMTQKSIELLEQRPGKGKAKGRPGFFLQVEGASIDKRDHAFNPCEQIGENVAFDEAVKVALDYQKKNPETLVIVTGDHAHTSQIIPTDATSPGKVSTLITADEAEMKVNYGTEKGIQTHTGSQIRVAAQGPMAQRVLGLTDQTDLFDTMSAALGVKR